MIDNSIPHMPGWRTVYTPGHTPGHVSLFRDHDRVLLAGDAVITIDQRNASKLVAQIREIHGPPQYFTPDWAQAAESIRTLSHLRPDVVATGHGLPMSGPDVADKLIHLAETFRPPAHGRYVGNPALADAQGVYYVPPAPQDRLPIYAAGIALAATGLLLMASHRRASRQIVSSNVSGGSAGRR